MNLPGVLALPVDAALPPVSRDCAGLLLLARSYHPFYQDQLANHLPMTLVALDRLGADAACMSAYFRQAAAKLDTLVGAQQALEPVSLPGRHQDYAAYCIFFTQAVQRDGLDAVLAAWLPRLVPGLAGAAFHCLIRVAYAIDAHNTPEACRALAFWVIGYQALPVSMSLVSAPASLAQIAAALAEKLDGRLSQRGVIAERLAELAQDPALLDFAMQPPQLTLAELAGFALEAYLAQRHFTLLHCVTACHALRLLTPWMAQQEPALRYLWQALCLAYVSVPRAAGAAGAAEKTPGVADWETCFAQARASMDEHQVKLCYSAWCGQREYGDMRYLAAAQRALGLD